MEPINTISVGYSLKHILEAMPDSLPLIRKGDHIMVKLVGQNKYYTGMADVWNTRLIIDINKEFYVFLSDCEKVLLINVGENITGE